MTDTLADIRKHADANVHVSTDSQTPEGTFTAVTKMDGFFMTYLLADSEDRETAPILGRVEDHNDLRERFQDTRLHAYAGDRLRGGTNVPFDGYAETFARLHAASRA